MINYNGSLIQNHTTPISIDNRGFKYGDALFETLKVVAGTILFWEDHYFRLMASMRMLRMDIPMNFTMEFLQEEILNTLKANNLEHQTTRVRLDVFRGNGGYYLPNHNAEIGYIIHTAVLDQKEYILNTEQPYIIDLYKDFYIANNLVSGLKTNNKILQVTGSIYAKENDFDNCLVLNTNKSVIEALNGNLFLVKDNTVKTPPLEDGCLRGVMRKQVLQLLVKNVNLNVEESSISPFELQKADELFITNVIKGIISITQYRKKQYINTLAKHLVAELNTML